MFKRPAEYNIKLNPKKLKIGLTEIEYVGQVLSAEGVNMSGEKILKVLDFVRPQTVKKQRSFLGLTAYFYKHILNYTLVVNPLHKMLLGWKNQSVIWDEQCIAAFAHIKAAIESCPKLFFLKNDAPIYTSTQTLLTLV